MLLLDFTWSLPVYPIWRAGGDLIFNLLVDRCPARRWGFAGPQRRNGPVYDSQLTVTLAGTPEGGTALTLVHTRLDDLAAAMPDVAAQVGPGWADVLAKLAAMTWPALR